MPTKTKTIKEKIPSLQEDFAKEISRSILLSDQEKQYWLENSATLPALLIEYFYKFIKEKNKLVDSYIDRAIKANPTLLTQIKTKVSGFRQFADDLTQKESGQAADENLEAELKNI
jgi:poly(3-hydroxyalkanoate) synthetase